MPSKNAKIVPDVEVDGVEVEIVVTKFQGGDFGLAFHRGGAGLHVSNVTQLIAQLAGFKIGDKIVAVDGVYVETLQDLKKAWNGGAKAMGDGAVTFEVMRVPKEGKSFLVGC